MKKPNKRQRARIARLVEYVRERSPYGDECVTVATGPQGVEHRRLVRMAIHTAS